MIAKISRGASVKGLANYLHGPGKANEHAYGGEPGGQVIGGNLGADGARDGSVWAADMSAVMDQRRDVERPVWHMSLRLAEGDPTLSDEAWRQIGQEMGERMGWAEHPWVMVRHGADHVHIAVSRVGFDGQLWHGRNDYREAQKARQVVERDWGLTPAPTRAREGQQAAQLTQGEHARAVRTGATPAREELRIRVGVSVDAAAGLGRETFERVLDDQGIAYRANVASTGRVSGYSFAVPEEGKPRDEWVWFKASQLGKDLSWSKMKLRLEAPLPEPTIEEPPKKLMESRGRHRERVEAARAQARAQDMSHRRAQAPQAARSAASRATAQRARHWKTQQRTSERTVTASKRAELARLKKVRQAAWAPVKSRPSSSPTVTKAGGRRARGVQISPSRQVPRRGRGEGLSR